MPQFTHLTAPTDGAPITRQADALVVPDRPILPFIEGDGTGADIWRASVRVFDAAVQKAYGGERQVVWFEVLAGEKAFNTVKRVAAGRHARPRSASTWSASRAR